MREKATHRRHFLGSAALAAGGTLFAPRPAARAAEDPRATVIERVELRAVRVPRVYTTRVASAGSHADKEGSVYWIVELRTADGLVGVGEVSDVEPTWNAPPPADIARSLAGLLVGADAARRHALVDETAASLPIAWPAEMRRMTGTAIDMALADLAGKRLRVPLVELLGGARRRRLPICWVVYIRDTAPLETDMREKVAAGFTAFKLKVGDDFAADREHAAAMRRLAGPKAHLRIDASGSWHEDEAIEKIASFARLGVDAVETPIAACSRLVAKESPERVNADVDGVAAALARVRRAVAPCQVIEHVVDFDDAFTLALARHDAVDVINVCPTQAGSLERARRLTEIAQAAGMRVLLGSTVELGPGTAAALAVGLASRAVTEACDLVGPGLLTDDIIAPPLAYDSGHLTAPPHHGLGIALDREKMRKYEA